MSEQPFFRIIFRTCDKVHSVHNTARPFGLDKRTLIKVCFLSLQNTLESYPHSIHIIADDISTELAAFFNRYNVTYTRGTFGNDESIRQSLTTAMSYADDDWVYICEDDYLHQPQTFDWINDLIVHRSDILVAKTRSNFKRWLLANLRGEIFHHPLFIHPPDYPDRYRPREMERSYLFLSQYCHWRQITNTTFTFMTQAKTLRKYKSALMRSTTGARDGLLSKTIYARDHFFGRALCVSPIPGLSTHMHEGVMTPLVNWQPIVHKILNQLSKE